MQEAVERPRGKFRYSSKTNAPKWGQIHPGWPQVEPPLNWERLEGAWRVEIEKRAESERGGKLQGVTRSEGGSGGGNFACKLFCMFGGVRRLGKSKKTGNHLQKNCGGSKFPEKWKEWGPKCYPLWVFVRAATWTTCWFKSTLQTLFVPRVFFLFKTALPSKVSPWSLSSTSLCTWPFSSTTGYPWFMACDSR